MASLKNIKLKIQSYKKTGTVTHAMEAVSAVKMRKSQERALSGRAYAAAGLSMLERLSATVDLSKHRLMDRMLKTETMVFVVVTSDKGLAGALNSAVIKATEKRINEIGLNKKNVAIVAIGRRGAEYFSTRGYLVKSRYENINDSVSESEILQVTQDILTWHKNNEIGACFVAYQNFVSTFEQQPVVRQIVPINTQSIREIISGIKPARGKYSGTLIDPSSVPASYTIEPDADAVLTELLPKLLNIALFHAVLENKASEHSARMVAMKSATDKSKELAQLLTRKFNKVRQAAITREVSEITSGIEAMR